MPVQEQYLNTFVGPFVTEEGNLNAGMFPKQRWDRLYSYFMVIKKLETMVLDMSLWN